MTALHPLVRTLLTLVMSVYKLFARLWLRIRSLGSGTSVAEQRVVSGEAWDEFCDTLKAAGASMLAPGAPTDALNQAEGYRYLARLARAGLENFLECSDVEAPRLCAIANGSRAARVCIGSDNPDNLYESATLDGRLEYVVSGDRGTVGYLGFGTQCGQYGKAGGLCTVDYVESSQLSYDERGRFSIILSAEKPSAAELGAARASWLRLERSPKEGMFIVRQTFGDRSKETPANLAIRRRRDGDAGGAGDVVVVVGGAADVPARLTAERLDDGLQSAAVLVAGASMMFAKWAHGFQAHTNQLPLFSQAVSNKAGGDPNIRYFHSYWRLGPGEALRITLTPPPCRGWNFQLNNHWMESLDYRYHQVHTNSSLARPDEADAAAFTIIVAHADPNPPPTAGLRAGPGRRRSSKAGKADFKGNWIDTVGHSQGTMCFRWLAPEVPDELLPHPRAAVVSFADL